MTARRSTWLVWALLAGGCSSAPAIVLDVSADSPVEQYNLFVRDDASGEVFFTSGWTPVSPPGAAPRDLTTTKLKIALKLSRGGKFTLLLVGVEGALEGSRPAPGATQLFWAARVGVDGTATLEARLLTVPPGDDQDGDYWPDAQPFLAHVAAAGPLYAQHTDVLDCDDKLDNPKSPVTMAPIKLAAKDVNPFAVENCMDGFDENCDGTIAPCVDEDMDHDFKGSDCDDKDPKRHHATDIDPFPDPPNCCGYSLGKTGADRGTDFLHDAGGAGCFAAACMHDAVLCPMKRCGDGVDESCAGADTTCIVDEDCDGYPAPPVGNDCDDHDPNVHPNAAEPCSATKDLNCDGVIGGCVPCDLDGDGYERLDAANGCPDAKDKHPGLLDCNDYDSGVYPGATGPCGGKEGGTSTLGMANCALRGGCRTVYESSGAESAGTARVASFAAIAGDADCDGSAYAGCPSAACDADGDGFPNAGAGCNPSGTLQLDCDDADPQKYPGAPDKCGDGIAQNCTADTACTQDVDGDGYNAGVDCDDTNAKIHPWAPELCNGVDDDCDGLTDEGNPDATGKPMIAAGAVTSCTDSNVGACAATRGTCVCSPSSGDAYTDAAGKRDFCPTENAVPAPAHPPRCFGAGQPKPQSCDALAPKDDDCDGRNDAPDGKNLAIKGMPCGVAVGQCKAGTITACDSASNNCFVAFGRAPANQKWYVCSATAVCPHAELCNGLDDDCDGTLAGGAMPPAPGAMTGDERDHDGDGYLACGPCATPTAPGVLGCGDCDDTNLDVHPGAKDVCNGADDDCNPATPDGVDECGVTAPMLPVCCGAGGCKNTQTDFAFCGSCTTACTSANANLCVAGGCRCGGSPPCPAGQACSAGVCTTGANGTPCTIDGNCTSGHCADGVCCSAASCGTCKTCNGTMPGMCTNAPLGPGDGCTGAGQSCDGGGNCKQALGTACGTNNGACASGHCADGVCCSVATCATCNTCNGATPGSCGISPLGPGNGCSAAGQTCDGAGNCRLANGATCPGSSPCLSGNCTDGVCCDLACSGACQRCNLAGSMGTCKTSPLGTAGRTACANNILCDGVNTTCQATCSSDFMCVSGDYCASTSSCAAQVANNGACSAAACFGGGNTCRQCSGNHVCPGTNCNNGMCSTDADCASGYYCKNNNSCTVEAAVGAPCPNNCKVNGCRQCAGDRTCSGASC